MAKLTGPLFSLDASGPIAKAIDFVSARRNKIARSMHGLQLRKMTGQAQTPTIAQIAQRDFWQSGCAAWNALSAEQKAVWASDAFPLALTGFNLFMTQYAPAGGVAIGLDTASASTYFHLEEETQSWSTRTIAAWVKIGEQTATYPGFMQIIGSVDASVYSWLGRNGTTGPLRLYSTDSGFSSDIADPSPGDWCYLAITHDGTTSSGYCSIANETPSVQSATIAAHELVRETMLGDQNGAYAAAGYVAYPRVWSRALSTAELNAERQSATPVSETNLVAAPTWSGLDTVSPWEIYGTMTTTDGPTYPA